MSPLGLPEQQPRDYRATIQAKTAPKTVRQTSYPARLTQRAYGQVQKGIIFSYVVTLLAVFTESNRQLGRKLKREGEHGGGRLFVNALSERETLLQRRHTNHSAERQYVPRTIPGPALGCRCDAAARTLSGAYLPAQQG